MLHDVSSGTDPATEKQAGRQVQTVDDLATLYIEKWAKPRKRSWKADDHLLRRKILPQWRNRAIIDITRQDVRQLVENVADAGAPIVANRVASLVSKLFAFALDRDLVPFSPAVRIARPGVETARDRVLTEPELRTVWATITAMPDAMAAFYKLRLLTAQRGGEVAAMRWRDVDIEQGWWTIPAAGSKNKLAHRVPLNAPAMSVVASLLAKARNDEEYVLAGARGKRQQAEAAALFTVHDFRGHDLRRTAASHMAGAGIPSAISKVLNPSSERSPPSTIGTLGRRACRPGLVGGATARGCQRRGARQGPPIRRDAVGGGCCRRSLDREQSLMAFGKDNLC